MQLYLQNASILSHGWSRFGAVALTTLLAVAASPANAQSDNFDDGDDAGWIRRDVIGPYGGINTYTFPDGPFGKGYRIQGMSSDALLGACGDCGTARAVVYRTNVYTDFYASVDVLNWDNSADQALVVIARGTGLDQVADPCPLPLGCPPGFGMFNGYICNYDANQDGSGPGDRRGGQFQINRVDQEAPTTLAAAEVTLIEGKAYRLVLKGVGVRLTAQLYDLEDLTRPIVTIETEDADYPAGNSGLISFSREGKKTDVTYDNYYAAATDPNVDIAPAIRHPVPGVPQVVTRTPAARFSTFHPPETGIIFTARTFTTNEISAAATKLYLNGQDASSTLVSLPGNGNHLSFSTAPGALKSNTVYSARIELQDTTGALRSTNTFWFDTFSEAHLTNLVVIEAEDYNYESGKFQLHPIKLSGYDTNGNPVGSLGEGYADLIGTPGVDYQDKRTSPDNGWNDYRMQDFVGTLQGNREDIEDLHHPAPTTPASSDPARPNDHLRRQYAALMLKEYQVARTEAGEWLNYTRVFPDTNYMVYLRVGSFGQQPVTLEKVEGDVSTTNQTTTALGTFNVPNQLMRLNYGFVPLTKDGAPALVNLAGTNTLRLTIGGTPVKDNLFLYLNYLLFVPVAAQPPGDATLLLERTATGLSILWSTQGYTLQSSPNLGTTTWSAITEGVVQEGNTNVYRISPGQGSMFYRLFRP